MKRPSHDSVLDADVSNDWPDESKTGTFLRRWADMPDAFGGSQCCVTRLAYVSGHFVGLRGHPFFVREGQLIVFGLSLGFVPGLYSC